MLKQLLKGVALLLVIPGLFFLVSCAETQVQQTTPDAPDAEITGGQGETVTEEAVADEKAAQEAAQRALEEEAIRREQEAALNMFVSEDIYFDYNESSLKSSAQSALKRKAVWLRNNPDVSIVIEGHCDDRGTTEYNLALGDRRANSAMSFLVDMGIEPTRLKTISYGEEMPVDPGKNEEAWSKNRRAHCSVE